MKKQINLMLLLGVFSYAHIFLFSVIFADHASMIETIIETEIGFEHQLELVPISTLTEETSDRLIDGIPTIPIDTAAGFVMETLIESEMDEYEVLFSTHSGDISDHDQNSEISFREDEGEHNTVIIETIVEGEGLLINQDQEIYYESGDEVAGENSAMIIETIVEGEGLLINQDQEIYYESGDEVAGEDFPIIIETIVEGEGTFLTDQERIMAVEGYEMTLDSIDFDCENYRCRNTEYMQLGLGDREFLIEAKTDLGGQLREFFLLDTANIQDTELGIAVTIPAFTKILSPQKEVISSPSEGEFGTRYDESGADRDEEKENIDNFVVDPETNFGNITIIEEILPEQELILLDLSEGFVEFADELGSSEEGVMDATLHVENDGIEDGLDLDHEGVEVDFLEDENHGEDLTAEIEDGLLDFLSNERGEDVGVDGDEELLATEEIFNIGVNEEMTLDHDDTLTPTLRSDRAMLNRKEIAERASAEYFSKHEVLVDQHLLLEGKRDDDGDDFGSRLTLADHGDGKSDSVLAFTFGMADQHVIFDKPVKISIAVGEDHTPGLMQILVRHHGDIDFSTHGLSVYADTQCLSDGSASLPGNVTQPQDGQFVFYSCGASDFIMFGANLPFVTTWELLEDDKIITIPTNGGGYDYTIDWGDGVIENKTTGDPSHSYATGGSKTIMIIGSFPQIYFNNSAMAEKIRSVEQWGEIEWVDMQNAFYGAANLSINAIDAPIFKSDTDISFGSMFENTSNLTGNFNHWDTSQVTNMSYMFCGSNFNQPIENWDTSQVTNMEGMFDGAMSFDQSLEIWNTSKVNNMNNMFASAMSFSQNISTRCVPLISSVPERFADESPLASLLNYHPQWGYCPFMLSFDSMGGTEVDSQIVVSGSTVTRPTDPTKTDYVFAAWYQDTGYTMPWDFEIDLMPDHNLTLYAKWLSDFTVFFETDGGSEVVSQMVSYRSLIPSPLDPIKTGYIFDGWYQNTGYTMVRDFAVDTMPAHDLTLYAKWDRLSFENCFVFDPTNAQILGYYNHWNDDPNNPSCPKDLLIPQTIRGISVLSIGEYAFYNKALTSLRIPDTVTEIGDYAFGNNVLDVLHLGNAVTSIGIYSFADNELVELQIPDSLLIVKDSAFAINPGHPDYQNQVLGYLSKDADTISMGTNTNLWLMDMSVSELCFEFDPLSNTITDYYLYENGDPSQANCPTALTIPQMIGEIEVKHIGAHAFVEKGISSLLLPNTLETIADVAFAGNALSIVSIPNTVTDIGAYAFAENQLTHVYRGNALLGISTGAFQNNYIRATLLLPDSLESLGVSAFENNQIESVILPTLLTTLAERVFFNNQIFTLDLDGITAIGDYSLSENNLSEIILPASLESVGSDFLSNNGYDRDTHAITTYVNNGESQHRYVADKTWLQMLSGEVAIFGPKHILLEPTITKGYEQILTGHSDYFFVEDTFGPGSAYYTTITLTDISGPGSDLGVYHLEIKADQIVALVGKVPDTMSLGERIQDYSSADTPIVFIQKEASSEPDLGSYGARLLFRITIAPYAPMGTYSANIVYTLYSED